MYLNKSEWYMAKALLRITMKESAG